jgi:hypothetical protein
VNEPNDLLRAHVTRVGFDLSLGTTHIAALVYLAECIRQRRYIAANRVVDLSRRRAFSHFASGMAGCMERGLVVHHYDERHRDGGLKWHYTITKAGRLVIDLLREAGIYQEYADALPELELEAVG